MYVADQRWPDLADYTAEESLAVVPLGSTEQHGPHLPLSTDHRIAESLARAATAETGHLCTPTVNVGVSPHHRQFHGTMWVDAPVFRDYVESMTRNLAYHGIDRVVFVNAHGGNVQHLREVGRRLRDDGTLYAVEWMWDESIPELISEMFERPGPHGGPKETSMLLHLDRANVAEERIEDARDGGVADVESYDYRTYGSRTFYDAIDNTENGVLGDQTDASAEVGAELFDAACEQLVALLTWLDDQPTESLMPKPHVDPQPGSRR